MSKTKTKKQTSNETYTISRGIATATNAPGRKPSKLGNTMRMLNIGDGFTYPYTSSAAAYNVRRAANTYGFEMSTKRTDKGVFAVRLA
jgi:hypothetical protein